MRKKKTIINASVNILSLVLAFLPNIIVRKTFLDTLGSEILGLVSLYSNIIGWLSIVEMGIGTAIVYSLYKPFYDKDYFKVSAYINYYKFFYTSVGFIIILLSIIISPFMKNFISGSINSTFVSIGFILFALNTLISYMFSHRLCILNVAQESYKITLTTSLSRLVISIFQYIALQIYPNFYCYILIQIIVNYIYYKIINMYIYKKYSYIFKIEGVLEQSEKYDLSINIKSLFMHKIGSLITFSTDSIIISKSLGLSVLTKYTNYQIIISAAQSLFNAIMGGATASIGNLIYEGNKQNTYNVFKNMMFLNFWLGSFIVISLYNTLDQFIILWLGKENTIDSITLILILFNTYFIYMRQSVETFKSASGIFYQDRYAPICEALINLFASLYLVNKIGLSGVFLGTLCSNLLVVFWVKPYILYKYLFKKNIIGYFYMYFKYMIIGFIPLFITNFLTSSFKYNYSFNSFIINCIINIIVINIIYTIIFYKSDEFKYFKNIFINIIRKIRV